MEAQKWNALAVVVAVAFCSDDLLPDLDGRPRSVRPVFRSEPDPFPLPANRAVPAYRRATCRDLALEGKLAVHLMVEEANEKCRWEKRKYVLQKSACATITVKIPLIQFNQFNILVKISISVCSE